MWVIPIEVDFLFKVKPSFQVKFIPLQNLIRIKICIVKVWKYSLLQIKHNK